MANDFLLKWDAAAQELYGEDPSTNTRIEIPLDQVAISDTLRLESAIQTLEPTTEPSSPSSGWTLYVDKNDNDNLKAKDSSGNITTISS